MSDPGDFLDGMCDLDVEVEYPTTDALRPWVVLFADMIGPDQEPVVTLEALEARAAEWRALFSGGGADGP